MDYCQVVQPSQLLLSGNVVYMLLNKNKCILKNTKRTGSSETVAYLFKHGQRFELRKTKSLLEVRMTHTKDIQIASVSC